MTWNASPVYIAFLFLVILIVYAQGTVIPLFRSYIFRLYMYEVLLTMVFSIITSIINTNFIHIDSNILQFANIASIILSTLAMLFSFLYIIAYIFERDPYQFLYMFLSSIPWLVVVGLALTNPFTDFIFYFDTVTGFVPANGYIIISYSINIYIVLMLLAVGINWNKIEQKFRIILLVPPILSTSVFIYQIFFPDIILSGVASTASLFIIYLYIQNRKLFEDSITGLQNNDAFSQTIDLYIRKNENLDLVLIHFNDYRTIYDYYGEKVSQEFMKEIALYMKSVVKPKNLFRYSGDQFAFYLKKEHMKETLELATAIKKRFASAWDTQEYNTTMSISVVVVRLPDQASTLEEATSTLDYCMSQAVKSNTDQIVMAEENTRKYVRRRNAIIRAMKDAIISTNFKMVFQPFYSLAQGKFVAAEALVRLNDPELGDISPGEFIPIAEETGMIVKIGDIILQKICRFIKRLEAENVPFEAIFTNFSVLQLYQNDVVNHVMSIINSFGVNPQRIRIETTESMFVDNSTYLDRVMRDFAKYQIDFAIDDFGTGYSNLARVIEMPFKYIKVDKSLVVSTMSKQKGRNIMEALLNAFNSNGMKIVIEGVETSDQLKMLESVHSDYIQGYLFSRPVDDNTAIKMLRGI